MKRWPFLATLSAAQLALLLAQLGRNSLWLDENMSLAVASGSWRAALHFFRSLPEQHPLYYLLLRAWLVFGTSQASVRLFSAVFALGTVCALFFLVERLLDRSTAFVAAALMALSPFLLYYGQEARMYTMLAFLTAFNCYWFVATLESDARNARAWYFISAVCGVYTHLFFWLVLLAQALFRAVRDWPRREGLGRLATSLAWVAVLYLPWALLLVVRGAASQSWKGVDNVIFGIPYTVLRFSLGYSE